VLVSSLALVCLLAASCDSFQAPHASQQTVRPFDYSQAVAVSVSADSVYLVDPASGEVKRVVTGLIDFQSGYAAWGPGHRKLAYGNGGIFILDPKTGKRTTLIKHPGLSLPAWSSSGKRMVYGDGSNLWITPTAKLDATYIQLPVELAPLSPAWRPGDQIAFSGLKLDCAQAEGCTSTEERDVWVIQADGTGLTQVSHVGSADSPKWAPDGRRILFIWRLGKHKRELWMIPEIGASPRRLIDAQRVIAADWSPDNSQVAYLLPGERDQTLQLWIADADGSSPYKVGPLIHGTEATLDW